MARPSPCGRACRPLPCVRRSQPYAEGATSQLVRKRPVRTNRKDYPKSLAISPNAPWYEGLTNGSPHTSPQPGVVGLADLPDTVAPRDGAGGESPATSHRSACPHASQGCGSSQPAHGGAPEPGSVAGSRRAAGHPAKTRSGLDAACSQVDAPAQGRRVRKGALDRETTDISSELVTGEARWAITQRGGARWARRVPPWSLATSESFGWAAVTC
jgi:hypothetical protein